MFNLFAYTDSRPLPLDAELAAIDAAQAGDAGAYETLLAAYGPAMRSAVARANTMDPEEAQGVALLTFAEVLAAHDTSDAGAGEGRLGRFLPNALRKALSAATADARSPLTIPSRSYERYAGILAAADGDAAMAYDLAPSYSMASETFAEIHAIVAEATYLDADEDGDGRGASASLPLAYEPYSEVEDRVLIDAAKAAMDDTEVRIVDLSYGFTEYDPQPDGEIAHRVGMSRPAVQRRRGKALDKARKALGVTPDSE